MYLIPIFYFLIHILIAIIVTKLIYGLLICLLCFYVCLDFFCIVVVFKKVFPGMLAFKMKKLSICSALGLMSQLLSQIHVFILLYVYFKQIACSQI